MQPPLRRLPHLASRSAAPRSPAAPGRSAAISRIAASPVLRARMLPAPAPGKRAALRPSAARKKLNAPRRAEPGVVLAIRPHPPLLWRWDGDFFTL